MADELKRVGLVFKADGSVDFQKALKEVNSSINENYSAFKLAEEQWDKNTKTADKLRDRQKYLSEQTKDYSDKVKILQEELKALESRAQKARQRRDEARAHEKNKRVGKTGPVKKH